MLVSVSPFGNAEAILLVVEPLAIIGRLVKISVLSITTFCIVLPRAGVDFTIRECELPNPMAFALDNLTNEL